MNEGMNAAFADQANSISNLLIAWRTISVGYIIADKRKDACLLVGKTNFHLRCFGPVQVAKPRGIPSSRILPFPISAARRKQQISPRKDRINATPARKLNEASERTLRLKPLAVAPERSKLDMKSLLFSCSAGPLSDKPSQNRAVRPDRSKPVADLLRPANLHQAVFGFNKVDKGRGNHGATASTRPARSVLCPP